MMHCWMCDTEYEPDEEKCPSCGEPAFMTMQKVTMNYSMGVLKYEKDPMGAIEDFKRAVHFNDEHSDSWRYLDRAYMNLQRWDDMIICADKLISIDPNDADAWLGKASALYAQEKYQDSYDCSVKGTQLDATIAYAWFLKGTTSAELGMHEEAIASLRYYFDIAQPDDGARNAAQMYLDDELKYEPKKCPKCGKELTEVAKFCSACGTDVAAALKEASEFTREALLASETNPQLAISYLEKALKITPNETGLWQMKGNAYSRLKDWEGALTCYNNSLATSASNFGSLWRKSGALVFLDRFSEAYICAVQATELDPDELNPEIFRAWQSRGLAAGYMGNQDEAEKCFRKCLELARVDEEREEAESLLETALRLKSSEDEPPTGVPMPPISQGTPPGQYIPQGGASVRKQRRFKCQKCKNIFDADPSGSVACPQCGFQLKGGVGSHVQSDGVQAPGGIVCNQGIVTEVARGLDNSGTKQETIISYEDETMVYTLRWEGNPSVFVGDEIKVFHDLIKPFRWSQRYPGDMIKDPIKIVNLTRGTENYRYNVRSYIKKYSLIHLRVH